MQKNMVIESHHIMAVPCFIQLMPLCHTYRELCPIYSYFFTVPYVFRIKMPIIFSESHDSLFNIAVKYAPFWFWTFYSRSCFLTHPPPPPPPPHPPPHPPPPPTPPPPRMTYSKAIDNNFVFSIFASRVILVINLGHDGVQFITNLFIPPFLPQRWDKRLDLNKNICTW